MAALAIPSPASSLRRPGGASLRLVRPDEAPFDRRSRPDGGDRARCRSRSSPTSGPSRPAAPRRRVSPEVRRRRTLLAVVAVCLLGLALPLGGTGGLSHATGSALAGTGHPVEYTVQPGDSLWSIAASVDPTADPRPLVAKMAAEIGSDTVQPGERITVP